MAKKVRMKSPKTESTKIGVIALNRARKYCMRKKIMLQTFFTDMTDREMDKLDKREKRIKKQ